MGALPPPPRRAAPDPSTAVAVSGKVKWFDDTKGFGFVASDDGGKDVFVHASAVEAAGMRTLNEGQKVSFDIQPDARGAKAANLQSV